MEARGGGGGGGGRGPRGPPGDGGVAPAGPGVDPGARERLFEAFFTTRPGGHGLGLAVARAVALGHGGRVFFDDGPGGRLRIELPIGDGVAASGA